MKGWVQTQAEAFESIETVDVERIDEYVWFDLSEAVRPLGGEEAPELPQRHPFLLID
ncbi:MAG: hypothetical protein ACLFVC_03430 [Opitutales bacterium]